MQAKPLKGSEVAKLLLNFQPNEKGLIHGCKIVLYQKQILVNNIAGIAGGIIINCCAWGSFLEHYGLCLLIPPATQTMKNTF